MEDDFKLGCGALFGIGMILLALCFGIAVLGLGWDRVTGPIREETRKQTYDTSRQYQQGTNRDIARYCEQMRGASTPAAKKAVAALIRSTASTYDGPLSPDNADCLTEAKGN